MRVLWTHNFDPAVPNNLVYIDASAEAVRARGVDLRIEYLGNLRSVSRLLQARARVRELAPGFDLVHAQYGSVCALATAAAQGVPKVVTIRGSDWNARRFSPEFSYLHARLSTRFTRAVVDRYDCVVSVSRRVAAELARFAPAALMKVIPSPIDLKRFVPRDKKEAKALLGFPGCTEKWVLFNALSLDSPVKRFDLAKRAFELAQARHGKLRLRLATSLSHDAMPLFAASCDLILCTSENEGWPNSVKEALACDVPFVATDVSDLRDIARDEPSCRICRPDPMEFADNICEVLAGTEPTGLRRHVSGMSLDAIGEQLVSTYQAVLDRYRNQDRHASAH